MSLSDDQMDTIMAWVDQGALEGNPADMPKAKPAVTTLYWQAERDGLRTPDLVAKSPEYKMPAREPGSVVASDVRHPGLTSRAGCGWSKSAVEHAGTQDPPSLDRASRAEGRSGSGQQGIASGRRRAADDPQDFVDARPNLMEWAIGKGYDRYPDGTGKLILPGETIPGTSTCTRSARKSRPAPSSASGSIRKARSRSIASISCPSRAQERAAGARHSAELDRAHGRLLGVEGKHDHHQLPAALPSARQGDDGRSDSARRLVADRQPRRELQLQLDDQLHLRGRRRAGLPEGDGHPRHAYYDNTTANKDNPDPNQWVGYGDRTVDEMAHAWMNVYYLSDAEYQDVLAQRKKATTNDNNQRQ
jgi:hypothetical protein